MHPVLASLFLAASLLPAAERASYDSNGRLVALIAENEDIEVSSSLTAILPTGKRIPLRQQRDRRTVYELPDGARATTERKVTEDETGVHYSISLQAISTLDVQSIEWVLELPRLPFLKGQFTPQATAPISLPITKPNTPALWSGETTTLRIASATGALVLNASFDRPTNVALTDRWTGDRRTYELRVTLHRGELAANSSAALAIHLNLEAAQPPPPVTLTLDTATPRFKFQGFGGNYCWSNQSPISAYTLDNLKLAWGRTEMKLLQWDKQKDNPGPELKADFETMRRFKEKGVPFVSSIWWLPERLYTDPHEKPRMAHFRLVHPDKWPEFLDLLGSYLLHLKTNYGVEPDLFSFNEANIGIYVGQSPEAHTEALKRIGAHFQKLGLKTKMLLGDATGPRDTHKFVLDAAADPEAMKYVAAIGFHSWGGGTPEQYKAWGDVAEWLNLPLLVTELGVDASAYMGRAWDSYHYGLREARMTQELLTHARPQGTQFWQFTQDYALARESNGKVEPSPRFHLMKHFTNLTPHQSEALAITSTQPSVLATAFRNGAAYAIHILNRHGARQATIEGLPEGPWRITVTTESAHFQQSEAGIARQGKLILNLPPRSLTTLHRAD
ncbi:MAG: hypothetical protein JST93_35435 [Acidobacteria bacterium]|nr:hypothetical protein [Acidobacteriota bacterium]